MLDRIRENSQHSFAVKAILVLIIFTFALAGISSYIGGSAEVNVASVNGEDISKVEYDRAFDNERSRMQQQLGDFYDTLAADDGYMQQMRRGVLEQLIEQKLAQQFAKDNGMRVSIEQVKKAIRDIPAFREAGQFSNDMYLLSLRQMGYTPERFAQAMQNDMVRSQLMQGVVTSSFMLPNELATFQRLQGQTRSGEYVTLAIEPFMQQVELDEQAVNDYYQANQAQFETPERVKVAYVEISREQLAQTVDVDESAARQFYDDNQDRYSTPEQRRVSHILIEFGDDEAAAKAKIDDIKQQLENGADFANLAQQNSDDTFSAEAGGDLEWLERGTMGETFEDAAFALQNVGDVSDVVKTEFGYHLIKLTDLREGTVEPFADVREELVSQMREQAVDKAYFEQQQTLAEVSFEAPDSLQPAAEALDLTVRQSDWFTRNNAPTPLSDAQLLSQIFSGQAVDEKLNSEVVDLGERSLVFRVTEHEPVAVKPLQEVKASIEQQLRAEQAQQLAMQEAQRIADAWLNGEAPSQELKSIDSVTRQQGQLPANLRNALFSMAQPSDAQPSIDTVAMNNGNVAVIKLTQVQDGNVDPEQFEALRERLANRQIQSEFQAFMEALKADAEITRYPRNL
ncbi:SurA N-terminal domain-containing protein [Idiomarina xiamenensis]|uniref:Periplasmic chaperone PpiD n=1 Tax=Idiomarina xiamenensis 10-D-4 TaxID=740709 RepID=K2L1T3_9GAMM|nr:SurA N-terminal domain-containing protein [Idiomarina xiamenensis]EKE83810.1 peptidyl-prolyl isomerase [Idiomarina xiamenensis 10-D-4]